jgi:uncharacterized protein YpuA (DUF1002 family)
MVFDLVEGLEQRESIPENIVVEGYGKIILEILKLVREQGKKGVDELSLADLLKRVKKEFASAEDEANDAREAKRLTSAV